MRIAFSKILQNYGLNQYNPELLFPPSWFYQLLKFKCIYNCSINRYNHQLSLYCKPNILKLTQNEYIHTKIVISSNFLCTNLLYILIFPPDCNQELFYNITKFLSKNSKTNGCISFLLSKYLINEIINFLNIELNDIFSFKTIYLINSELYNYFYNYMIRRIIIPDFKIFKIDNVNGLKKF